MKPNSDSQCPFQEEARRLPPWRRLGEIVSAQHAGARTGLFGLLAAPLIVSVMASSATVPSTVAIPTRLLATSVVAPTQQPGISVIHGTDLINLLTPYIEAAYGTPPTPIAEIEYPGSLDSGSLEAGVLALQTATAGDSAPVMSGLSQGAKVIGLYKKAFNEQYANAEAGTIPTPTYVLIGNSARPNGGFAWRLSALGVTVIGGSAEETIPTPTETAGALPGQITTHDYVRQYDFFADFPNRPLNLLSTVNAMFGVILAHGSYGPVDASNGLVWEIMARNPYGFADPSDAVFQAQKGDTAYYMIPSEVLPILQPLAFFGVPQPIIAALDAPLRVLVEAGYDRTINPGEPTSAEWSLMDNPIQTAINFLVAIPTGLDDGLEQLGLGRPFGTTPAGPYGVGGPPVTLSEASSSSVSSNVLASPATAEASADEPDASVASSTDASEGVDLVENSAEAVDGGVTSPAEASADEPDASVASSTDASEDVDLVENSAEAVDAGVTSPAEASADEPDASVASSTDASEDVDQAENSTNEPDGSGDDGTDSAAHE